MSLANAELEVVKSKAKLQAARHAFIEQKLKMVRASRLHGGKSVVRLFCLIYSLLSIYLSSRRCNFCDVMLVWWAFAGSKARRHRNGSREAVALPNLLNLTDISYSLLFSDIYCTLGNTWKCIGSPQSDDCSSKVPILLFLAWDLDT